MAIIKKEAYFNSSTGVNKIRTLIWSDDSVEPSAVFQISHGVGEHMERYSDFAEFLASKGFIVCGNDHIGHGKSVDCEDDLGFTAEKDGYRRMVDDMHILYSIMHRRYPELPYILFGHSMGSLCARVYASTFGADLAGLIICGTVQVPSGLNFTIDTFDKLAAKFGPRTVNSKVASLINKTSALGIPDRVTDFDWLSYNKENVRKYIEDPLCGSELSLAGIRDLACLGILASDNMCASTIPVDLPIFIISGNEDPVGFNGKAPVACADALEKTGHTSVETVIYPHARHEILNEDCKEKVYYDILGWLNTVLF